MCVCVCGGGGRKGFGAVLTCSHSESYLWGGDAKGFYPLKNGGGGGGYEKFYLF